ncbi:MAG: cytochrome P450 [Pseudomonadota bacterium]
MALDDQTVRPRPVSVPAPEAPLGMWASYRTARRNVLELIPKPAFEEPVLQGGRGAGWLMLMDPEGLQHVLKTREADYPKSAITQRILRPRVGTNLIVSEGHQWHWQRRAMTPMFQQRALKGIAPIMSAAAETTAARIAAGARAGPVDVYPLMTAATCDVICDAALSGREALDREAIVRGVDAFIAKVARISLLDLLGVPQWVPRPGQMLNRGAVRIDQMMDGIIDQRLARGPSDTPDMLDLLIGASDPETEQSMARPELRNNLLAFIIAGHETTALALTWALYLLALDQGVQTRARDEAQAALGDRAAGAEDLARLGLARRIIDESLRLYPPAGFLTRTARVDDTVSGRSVKAGATLILPVYALHRHRLLWDDPDGFDPDRFLPEAARARSRYAYLPFGGGPRICIGFAFAIMEAQIILATLLARYRFRLPEGFTPEPKMWFTLRPGTGMPLIAERL